MPLHRAPPGSSPGRRILAAVAVVASMAGATSGWAEENLEAHEAHHEHHHHHLAATSAGETTIRRTANVAVTVPNVVLLRDTGETADLAAELARGGPVYVNFIYTSCTSVCPVMSQLFSGLEAGLLQHKDAARLISISIDPAYDTPSRLASYAKNFRGGSDWTFLTGTVDASVAVQKAFGVYKLDKMDHEVASFYRAEAGSPWVRIDGFATPDQLLAERDMPAAAR